MHACRGGIFGLSQIGTQTGNFSSEATLQVTYTLQKKIIIFFLHNNFVMPGHWK